MRFRVALLFVAAAIALPVAAAEIWRAASAGAATDATTSNSLLVAAGERSAFTLHARTELKRNPFRIDGRMRPPTEPALALTVPDATPNPVYELLLKGLVGGPPWTAIVAGLPGASGDRSVRQGERFGELLISEITADWVRVVAGDSSWTLSLHRRHTR